MQGGPAAGMARWPGRGAAARCPPPPSTRRRSPRSAPCGLWDPAWSRRRNIAWRSRDRSVSSRVPRIPRRSPRRSPIPAPMPRQAALPDDPPAAAPGESGDARGRARGQGSQATVRFEGVGMRYGRAPRGSEGTLTSLSGAGLLPFPYRRVGGWKEFAPEAHLPGPPSLARADPPVRPGCVDPGPGALAGAPAPNRSGVPGVPPTRPPVGLRQRGAAAAHRQPQARRLPARTWRSSWSGSGSVGACTPCPRPFPAGRSSGWPSPGPWSCAPDILIADEPTGNVDPEMSLRLLRLFVEMNRLGATVLIASHDHDPGAPVRQARAAPRGRTACAHASACARR